jgi:UDP-N-acetylglucosamine/UDP-N-acetylgalactosamine diphosphorylase
MNLHDHLCRHDQSHILEGWDGLSEVERERLAEQIAAINFPLLRELHARREQPKALPDLSRIQPISVRPRDHEEKLARPLGEAALERGEVAVLMVAGGQGTRLSSQQPKGMFEIAPVSNKTLFQIHAEKLLVRGGRHACRIPFLVMTSPATHAETVEFFQQKNYFGLRPDDVEFFCQGTMPVLDLATGRLLMEGPGRLALSPNGHGGTLAALRSANLFAKLRQRGVKHIFYFQVDNPLVKVADPLFLGQHIRAQAQVSSKVTPKFSPQDKVGNFVLHEGRCTMIEYIHLPEKYAVQRDAHGQLLFRAGNPAIHIFDVDFLEGLQEHKQPLPFHLACKKVKYWDARTNAKVTPEKENALKFEKFIFDILPKAQRWLAVETMHADEFAPLKNMEGPDSPDIVRKAMSDLHKQWLKKAGMPVPENEKRFVEIEPITALDLDDLLKKVNCGRVPADIAYLTR